MLSAHVLFDFVVCFRGSGWRHPLQVGDEIEVFAKDHRLVATLSARIVSALLAHHLDALAMQARLAEEVNGHGAKPPVAVPPRRMSELPFTTEDRERRKALRKARKR